MAGCAFRQLGQGRPEVRGVRQAVVQSCIVVGSGTRLRSIDLYNCYEEVSIAQTMSCHALSHSLV